MGAGTKTKTRVENRFFEPRLQLHATFFFEANPRERLYTAPNDKIVFTCPLRFVVVVFASSTHTASLHVETVDYRHSAHRTFSHVRWTRRADNKPLHLIPKIMKETPPQQRRNFLAQITAFSYSKYT